MKGTFLATYPFRIRAHAVRTHAFDFQATSQSFKACIRDAWFAF